MIFFVIWANRLEYYGVEITESSQRRLLTLAEFFITTKGIMHFRFWSKMRFELKMIKQVITDMGYFLLLVFMFVIQFTIVFAIYAGQLEGVESLKNAFDMAFNLMLAANDPNAYDDPVLYGLFLLGVILVPIVMLNLLVSVIGDTFDNVQQEQYVANYKEMAELCLEVEEMMFWNRAAFDPKYLYIVRQVQEEGDGAEPWEGKIAFLKNRIESINGKISRVEGNVASLNEKMDFLISKFQ